jgi:2-polyprenyl-3-methyl-5-hydroxy-6-metoxy-1,4-benzoquinol methylase
MDVTAVDYARAHWRTQYKYSPSEYIRMAKRYRHNFRRLLPQNKQADILDVGCAGGFFLYFLRSEGFMNARGIDPDPSAVEAARSMELPAQMADAFQFLEEHEGCFDAITINQVIEHFPRESSLDLLRLIRNALRPHGRIIVSVPNGMTVFSGHMLFGDLSHDHLYTPKSLSDSLHSSGFINIVLFPEEPAPYDALTAVRWALWKMRNAYLKVAFAIDVGPGRANRVPALFTPSIIATGVPEDETPEYQFNRRDTLRAG